MFLLKLMIYADYFMLPRLVERCTHYITPYVNSDNVLSILLVAHAHNAEQLENFCLNMITMNENRIFDSREWRHFKR